MKFRYVQSPSSLPEKGRDVVYLVDDNWDDWGKYRTMFTVVVFDERGIRYDPGWTKIAHKGLRPGSRITKGQRAPRLKKVFHELGSDHFSLGQSEDFYEVMGRLPPATRREIFSRLRDCAYDLTVLARFREEDAMRVSLLRGVAIETVRNRFHRLAHGQTKQSAFSFEYRLPKNEGPAETPVISFDVYPGSTPPTNVHVLIGRNGVGKTRCIHGLIRALVSRSSRPKAHGRVTISENQEDLWAFAGLVGVMFSSFDRFIPPKTLRRGMRADFLGPGLRSSDPKSKDTLIRKASPLEYASAFVSTIEECRRGPKRERLLKSLSTLESDPLFAEADPKQLLELESRTWFSEAMRLFRQLSSGHAIVLLTVARLVAVVEERTIVVIDEPESHLHPPLLSALIRTVSELLVDRNGVAIVATHSPVVLQEVPRSCAWLLTRTGLLAKVERPSQETFGENVGILTRAVFDLEVVHSGFHRLLTTALAEAKDETDPYEAVLEKFNDQLGLEGRTILRSLIGPKQRKS